jgi:hypothetical protein
MILYYIYHFLLQDCTNPQNVMKFLSYNLEQFSYSQYTRISMEGLGSSQYERNIWDVGCLLHMQGTFTLAPASQGLS